jgi:PAS domain S-box-containing protein
MELIAEKNDILFFEDKDGYVTSIREMMGNESGDCYFNIQNPANFSEGLSMLSCYHFDAILLDLGLSDVKGLDALRMVHNKAPSIPIIVLTESQEEYLGALALGDGAQDYLIKGNMNGTMLIRAISHAIKYKLIEESFVLKDRAIECSIECITFADMCGKIVYANASLLRSLGYESVTNVSGRNLFDIVSSKGDFAFTLKSLIEKGSWLGENKVSRMDGSLIDVLLSASIVKNYCGESLCMMVAWVDISDRKTAENALKIMDIAISSSLTAIATMDIGGNLISGNEAFLKLVGVEDSGAIIGKPINHLLMNVDGSEDWLHAIRKDANWSGELSFKNPTSSSEKWVKGTINLVKDIDLNPLCLFGSFIEITEQKKAKEMLLASEKKYRQLFELANEGIWVADKEGILIMVNPRLAALLNCNVDDIVGSSFHSFIDEKNVDQGSEGINQQKNQTSHLSQDMPLRRNDGSNIWVNVTSSPIMDDAGEYIGSLAFLTDISERKQIEIQLKNSKQESDKAKLRAQKYFDLLVHDMANIVSPILVYSQMISGDKGAPQKINELCEEIQHQSLRASSLISNLRRLDEIEKIPAKEIENVDLIRVLKSIESSICEQFADKTFTIMHSFPRNKEIIVKGFSIIDDVLRKVLDNAARHSKNKIVNIEVRVSKCNDTSNHTYWQVDIIDDGPGIPSEYKASLMTHPESSNYLIRGIYSSLQFCAQLMSYIGGELRIYDSLPGDMTKGTRVTLKLQAGD